MQATLAHIHSSQSTHTRMALQGAEVGHSIASLGRRLIPKTVLEQFQRDEASLWRAHSLVWQRLVPRTLAQISYFLRSCGLHQWIAAWRAAAGLLIL